MFLVCTVILALHSIFQPYQEKRPNMVETGYLATLCIITIMQVLVDLEEIETETRAMAMYVSWFLSVLPVAHLSFLLLSKTLNVIRKKYYLLRSGREGYEDLNSTAANVDQDNDRLLGMTISSEVDQD